MVKNSLEKQASLSKPCNKILGVNVLNSRRHFIPRSLFVRIKESIFQVEYKVQQRTTLNVYEVSSNMLETHLVAYIRLNLISANLCLWPCVECRFYLTILASKAYSINFARFFFFFLMESILFVVLCSHCFIRNTISLVC